MTEHSEDLAARCQWCGCRLEVCRPLREHQRKCCPDCEHRERGRTVEVPAYDLLRMAYDAIGTYGVLDYVAERGTVFARGDGEYPSGKRWKFVTEDHAPDLFGRSAGGEQ